MAPTAFEQIKRGSIINKYFKNIISSHSALKLLICILLNSNFLYLLNMPTLGAQEIIMNVQCIHPTLFIRAMQSYLFENSSDYCNYSGKKTKILLI